MAGRKFPPWDKAGLNPYPEGRPQVGGRPANPTPKAPPPPPPPTSQGSSPPATAPQTNNEPGPAGPQSNNNPGGPGVYYDQLASLYRAQGAAEAANMRDSIRQMLIGMGLVPGGFQDKFGALDDTTRELIRKNTDTGISTYARLNEQKSMGIKDLINRLNARGLRRSGARGYGLKRNQTAYDRNLNDVMSQLMQQVGSMYGNYSANEYARQAALIMAAMNSYSGGGGSSYTPGPSGGSSNPGSGSTPYTGPMNVGSGPNYDNPTGELYNAGGGWWYY